jgi:DNA polymerase-1
MDRSDPDKGLRRKVHQLQNIPRKLRDAFVPDLGHVMIGGDWAGIEWAIAMWFCSKVGEPAGYHEDLLDRFQSGLFDPHRFLAAKAFGVSEAKVTKRQRKICKAYTHGRMFAGTGIGLAREVGHPQRIGIQVCNAHDVAFKHSVWQSRTVALVRKQHYIQTALGWRRYFWEWKPKPQEVLATLVQGTAADLCKYVLRDIFETQPSWVEVLTTTHDSLLLQVPLLKEEEGAAFLKEKMEQPIPWLDNRTWRADIKTGMSWREVS